MPSSSMATASPGVRAHARVAVVAAVGVVVGRHLVWWRDRLDAISRKRAALDADGAAQNDSPSKP